MVSATVVPEDSPSELGAAIRRYKSSKAARAEDAAKNQDIAARLFGGAATELLNAELEAVSVDARTRREVPGRDSDAR